MRLLIVGPINMLVAQSNQTRIEKCFLKLWIDMDIRNVDTGWVT